MQSHLSCASVKTTDLQRRRLQRPMDLAEPHTTHTTRTVRKLDQDARARRMRGGEPWPADFDVRIERLEQHYREVHEAEIRSKERALLEQVAYALAGLVESFVFAAAPTGEWLPLTLTQISKRATVKAAHFRPAG